MKREEIIQTLDRLLHDCKLDEAEAFLAKEIAKAESAQDDSLVLSLRNEQIGFFRDCGKFPEALETARKLREQLESKGDTHSVVYATTLLNCANAYRAAGEYGMAFDAYEIVQKLYETLLPETDGRVASFWNNLALLYQETQQWENACTCLEKALSLVRLGGQDRTRIAISCTNLAVCRLRLSETETALSLLKEADEILAGCSPSDFHYSATLAAFGDAYYQKKQYALAAEYYEMALSEIELHMGRNNFYDIVLENLATTYQAQGTKRPVFSGMELCKRFYKHFGAPMLERNFPELLPKLTIGLFGEGSECLGFDDALSRDHDFGPGFCILVPNDTEEKDRQALQDAYDHLPSCYYGVKRLEMPQANGRVGVCTETGFYSRVLHLTELPKKDILWLRTAECDLAAACSGEIFRDDSGNFTRQRRILKNGMPKGVRMRHMAQHLGKMAQCGQYNFPRMRKRQEFAAAQLYLTEFCTHAMELLHLLAGEYAPYQKWLVRSTKNLGQFSKAAEKLEQLLLLPPKSKEGDPDRAVHIIEELCEEIRKAVVKQTGISDKKEEYLMETAEKLVEHAEEQEKREELIRTLVKIEFETFDRVENLDGRAECQDNWETFSIMRTSQYAHWENEMLAQWIREFQDANQQGRNLISEKYARMMESTDPELYAEMVDKLPVLSEEFLALRESIVAIQVTWMEEFSKAYPNLALRSRVIYTTEDTKWETSYETYLRGELSVYSFDLLYLYGRWVAGLYQQGENLTTLTMAETARLYGYQSLEDAEAHSGIEM